MLWLYRFLFVPVLLAMAPAYVWRMRKRGGYGQDFGQRFGGGPRLPAKTAGRRRLWLQAVSVGEMLAIGPLLDALYREGVEVYLTTTTSTGYRLARERYAAITAGVGYYPLDAWPCVSRAWSRIDPDLVVLTEGERWPELLHQAKQRGVPVIGVNARLSDRSFARLRRFPGVARLLFEGMAWLLPGSDDDATRFAALGFPRERMRTTGNLKLDVQITPLTATERVTLRRELGLPDDGLVLLGSSTWPGEEAALVAALQQVRAGGVRCALLLVPRHAERRLEIERELEATGLRFHFRSRGPAAGETDVAVGDTTGELRAFTQLADLVFVGKSLAPHTGGQTPVEAAALEKPILFGPGMGNFRPIARDLLARGAAAEVATPAALAARTVALLGDPVARARLAAAAAQWRRANAGAVARTLAVLREELGIFPPDSAA